MHAYHLQLLKLFLSLSILLTFVQVKCVCVCIRLVGSDCLTAAAACFFFSRCFLQPAANYYSMREEKKRELFFTVKFEVIASVVRYFSRSMVHFFPLRLLLNY